MGWGCVAGGSCGVFVCIEEGWGGASLDTTGNHGGGPSLIPVPLMPAGNLWDRHALSKHAQTPSPPPRWSPLPLLRMWRQWRGWAGALAEAQMRSEVWPGHTPRFTGWLLSRVDVTETSLSWRLIIYVGKTVCCLFVTFSKDAASQRQGRIIHTYINHYYIL